MSRSGTRHNNFGILRLVLAALVVVSHSPEIIDGNRSREVLTNLFGTMSFGEFAVDGFFIISGYLITKSFVDSKSAGLYLMKRILRIVPGYAVCFLICVFCLAPFVGGIAIWSTSQIERVAIDLARLHAPEVKGVFIGQPYPALNGSMWTIAYEFRCYLAVAFFGAVAVPFVNRWWLLVGVAGLLLLNAMAVLDGVSVFGAGLIGSPYLTLRFAAVFGVGACYYLFRDYVRFSGRTAAVFSAALVILMFRQELAEAALCILGGYVLLWIAFEGKVTRLGEIANATDLSYGLYLYAWPVQSALFYVNPSISPWQLSLLSLLVAGVLAYVSWKIVEKPCLQLSKGRLGSMVATKPEHP